MPFAWRINITKSPKEGGPAVYTFEETPQIQVGDVIFWSNNDSVPHWPALATNKTALLSNQIAANSSSSVFAPGRVGQIKYICALHDGESGVIDVQAPPKKA